MKALLLAGGPGTRLRPLTLGTPKPIVPIFNRPFLYYQLDLLQPISEIDEVILSLNYQPHRIEEAVAHSADPGVRLRYLVEPEPLGTAGAVKFAERYLDGPLVVFNGDVLTQVDLAAVLRLHRDRGARATIVLTRVENPEAYGLVEADAAGNVRAFREKPEPGEITSNTINAGIYVLEPATLDRIPANTNWSIERSYFPSLVERRETFVAYVSAGYWIDIGTPAKYLQVHRDIMESRYAAPPFAGHAAGRAWVAPDVVIEAGAIIEGPCFVDVGCRIGRDARVGRFSVLGRGVSVGPGVQVDDTIVWPATEIRSEAILRGAVIGLGCIIGRSASVGPGAVLGDGSTVTDFSHV